MSAPQGQINEAIAELDRIDTTLGTAVKDQWAEVERLRERAEYAEATLDVIRDDRDALRHELELVVEQVDSCCSRAGLCVGTARIREALARNPIPTEGA